MRFLAPFLTIALIVSIVHASSVVSSPYPVNSHYGYSYYPSYPCCPTCYEYHAERGCPGLPLADMICELQSRMASPPEELPSSAVLILKDGTRINAPEYSIVGSTVWVLGTDTA